MNDVRDGHNLTTFSDPIAALRVALRDHYDIERQIGQGAFATVYLARDLKHERKVAIKVLNADPTSERNELRFIREIRLLARLQHPNILPLHDSGHVETLLYYVMPYLSGETLRDRMNREKQLSPDAACTIAKEAADALAYAHAQGIIHRDIKPENILLSAGHPVLADFGIARVIDLVGVRQLTRTGAGVPGTPAYMSPEQLMGDRELDGRSDTYSLGCVLYEMLSGKPPFAGKDGFVKRFTEPPPRVSGSRRGLSPWIDDVVAKALARSPTDRYPTANEFVAALCQPQAEANVGARVDAMPMGIRFNRVRRPVWIATAAGTLLIATFGITARRGAYSRESVFPSIGDVSSGRRVIITPLENRTGSPTLDTLGVMAVDWITSGLQRVRALEVVPTPTALQAFRFVRDSISSRTSRDPVAAVASETGANIVVTGAVYRRGDRLLYRLQVTDVGQKKLVATLDDIEAQLADPLAGVDEARARLMGWFAGQHDERISAEMSRGALPPVYPAYVAFSEGLDHYIANDFGAALPKFLKAYAVDSSFSASILYASLCYFNLGDFARSDSLLRIVDRSRVSLSDYDRAWLDYRLALLAGNFDAALTAIRAAASLAPDSKAAYNYAGTAYNSGRPQQALPVLEHIPPERGPMRGFLPYWGMLAAVNHALGHYTREREIGLIERSRYPSRLIAFAPEVRSMAVQGQIDSLKLVLDEAETFPPDPIGPNFGDLVVEAAEELRAHGHQEASLGVFGRAYAWYRATNHGVGNTLAMTRVAYALGRYREANSLAVSQRAGRPSRIDYLGLTGLTQARLGNREKAIAIADTLGQVRRPYQFGAATVYRARIAAVLGDREGAVARLREAFKEGKAYNLWFHREADFESLRDFPPFQDLGLPMNLVK